MSAVETPAPSPGDAQPRGRTCPRCDAGLTPEQDWCLNCGSAVTTHVERASGWRLPVAVVAAVLVLAAGAALVAFVELADDPERVAQTPAPTPAAATPVPTATPSPDAEATATATPTGEDGDDATGGTASGDEDATAAGDFPAWPEGRAAWTVILHSAQTQEDAEARARELESGGTTVGVLRSDDYASLREGYWVVFSGEYDTQEAAEQAAEELSATAEDAYPRLVEPR